MLLKYIHSYTLHKVWVHANIDGNEQIYKSIKIGCKKAHKDGIHIHMNMYILPEATIKRLRSGIQSITHQTKPYKRCLIRLMKHDKRITYKVKLLHIYNHMKGSNIHTCETKQFRIGGEAKWS